MKPTQTLPPMSFNPDQKTAFVTDVTTRYLVDFGNGMKVELTAAANEPFHITCPGGIEVNLYILQTYPDGVLAAADGAPVH